MNEREQLLHQQDIKRINADGQRTFAYLTSHINAVHKPKTVKKIILRDLEIKLQIQFHLLPESQLSFILKIIERDVGLSFLNVETVELRNYLDPVWISFLQESFEGHKHSFPPLLGDQTGLLQLFPVKGEHDFISNSIHSPL